MHAPIPVTVEDLLHHRELLRALARRLSHDEASADDVVQEVWVRALESPPRHRRGLRGWLARVARNVARDRAAGEAARRERERRRPAPGRDPDPRSELGVVEHLGAAFTALPAPYREALFLRYYGDRRPEEIARLCDCPVATVKTRLRRGLELLRRDLRERLGEKRSLRAALAPLLAARDPLAPLRRTLGWCTLLHPGAVVAVSVALVGGAVWLADLAGLADTARGGPRAEGRAVVATAPAPPATEAGPRLEAASATRRPRPANAAVGPVQGRVVYASTGQGVPFYRFDLAAGGAAETVTTDAVGRFRSTGDLSLRLRLSLPGVEGVRGTELAADTGGDDRREVTRRDAGESVTVAVRLGPTYLLDLGLPPDRTPADLRAGFGRPGEPAAASESVLEVFTGPEPASGEHFGAALAAIPALAVVRAGPPSWVRFPRSVLDTEEPGARLVVHSRDGRLGGVADVGPAEGVVRVSVDLRGQAALGGTVTDERGLPVAGVWVRLQGRGERGGEGNGSDRASRMEATDADGRYRFGMLEAGTYALSVRDEEHLPWSAETRVSERDLEGPDLVRDAVLVRRPSGGRIAGRITSATGAFAGHTFLFLEGRGDQDVWRSFDVVWREEAEGLVGRFAFEDVGHGTYRLTCNTVDAVPLVDRDRRVVPPDETLHFHVRDDVPRVPLALRVVDAASGRELPGYLFLFQAAGNFLDPRPVSPSEPLVQTVAEGLPFTWHVFAEGYRAAHGDEADFRDVSTLVVPLEPGFSAVVHTLSIASLSDLSDVTVLADGKPAGRTNEDGFVFLDLPRRPATLGFDPERWRVEGDGTFVTDVDPATGAFVLGEHEAFVTAYLRAVE